MTSPLSADSDGRGGIDADECGRSGAAAVAVDRSSLQILRCVVLPLEVEKVIASIAAS